MSEFSAVTVVLDASEQAEIERAAAIREVSVAEFVRRSAVTFAVMTNGDQDTPGAVAEDVIT